MKINSENNDKKYIANELFEQIKNELSADSCSIAAQIRSNQTSISLIVISAKQAELYHNVYETQKTTRPVEINWKFLLSSIT